MFRYLHYIADCTNLRLQLSSLIPLRILFSSFSHATTKDSLKREKKNSHDYQMNKKISRFRK
jgi:hypothetical protein